MKRRTNLLKTMTAMGLTLALGITTLTGCGASDTVQTGGTDSKGTVASASSASDLEPVTLKLWS